MGPVAAPEVYYEREAYHKVARRIDESKGPEKSKSRIPKDPAPVLAARCQRVWLMDTSDGARGQRRCIYSVASSDASMYPAQTSARRGPTTYRNGSAPSGTASTSSRSAPS